MASSPTAPALGFINFESTDNFYQVTVRLGDGNAKITNTSTGWGVTDRPRRRGITEWNGSDPLTIDIPILIDHFISGDGITCEADCQNLELMAGQYGDGGEPQLINFNAHGAVPHDFHNEQTTDWIISQIAWGDASLNSAGNRIRQAAVVTVMEYVADHVLKIKTSAQKNRDNQHPKHNTKKHKKPNHRKHHVQPGETLSTIARDEYADPSAWRDIAAANPKHKRARRDPKDVTVGETLRLPTLRKLP